ncbi:hypothetical protein ACFQX6_08385 [Streptosporangium lutulentum]
MAAEFVRGEAAVALDAARREVTTASGRVLRGEVVVVATGLTSRRLPGQDGPRACTRCAAWTTRSPCART